MLLAMPAARCQPLPPHHAGRWNMIAWRRLASLLLLLTGLSTSVQAETLLVCVSDEPFPPFTAPDHEERSQQLIRQAGELQGWQVQFVAQPWRRCLAGVEQDVYSAVAGVAATAEYRALMAFPLQGEQADPSRALGLTRLLVYRLMGSEANWDGQHFSILHKPVLYLAGRATLKARLAALGVDAVDAAHHSIQLARMLLNDRGSLVVDHDYQIKQLLDLPEFKGRLEVLPQPFADARVYLAVGQRFYNSHCQQVEALWNQFATLQRKDKAAINTDQTAAPWP